MSNIAVTWSAAGADRTDYTLYRGQSGLVTATRSAGSGSIAAWTLTFSVKKNLTDSAAAISKTVGAGVTITDAAAGTITISLTSSDLTLSPGVYFWDLQRTNSGSEDLLAQGFLTIKGDVRI